METAKSILLATTVTFIAIGAWPIAIPTAIAALTLSEVISHQRKKAIKILQEEVKNLKKNFEEAGK